MEKAQASEKPAQYLTFTLAGDEYAAGILQVKEIIEYQPPTRVPQTPHPSAGSSTCAARSSRSSTWR